MTTNAAYWIKKLELQPHPEGGHYRQTYCADLKLPRQALSPEFSGPRPASTAIYFLLEAGNFSAFHRLRSDELWHFYLGDPLLVHVIEPNGAYALTRLGRDAEAGELFQAAVKAGCWFASELVPNVPTEKVDARENSLQPAPDRERFALVGCTVAPGFDFEDFELGHREDLVRRYPRHQALISRLTRA